MLIGLFAIPAEVFGKLTGRAPSPHELFSRRQMVNLRRLVLVNLNRRTVVSLNRRKMVTFTGAYN
jgi:hypothetical protein